LKFQIKSLCRGALSAKGINLVILIFLVLSIASNCRIEIVVLPCLWVQKKLKRKSKVQKKKKEAALHATSAPTILTSFSHAKLPFLFRGSRYNQNLYLQKLKRRKCKFNIG
jgi:hypothetical protein